MDEAVFQEMLSAELGAERAAFLERFSEYVEAGTMEVRDVFEAAFLQGFNAGARRMGEHLGLQIRRAVESGSLPCSGCGDPVGFEFSVSNDLWNRVVRRGRPETDREYLCFGCFLLAFECYAAELEEGRIDAEDGD